MKELLNTAASISTRNVPRLLALLLLLLLTGVIASAQSKPSDGSTPLGLQAGAPDGSYALSGFDNINLYDGTLNFRLPLLKVSGRGGAGDSVTLAVERHWMAEFYDDGQGNTFSYAVDGREEEIKPGYGPGVMAERFGGTAPRVCPTPVGGGYDQQSRYTTALTRLSFTSPDGTETEFRDQATGAQGEPGVCQSYTGPSVNGFDRGTVFVSADGSMSTFVSDADIYDQAGIGVPELHTVSGFMLLKDGTRYRIDNGLVSWIRDRNGNLVTFNYDANSRVTSIKDSLNRQVTIAYDVAEGGQYGTCDHITYTGFGGATRLIRVSKSNLGSALRSGYALTTTASLFPGLQGSSFTNYDPTVVSSVWLPDSDGVTRRYRLYYNPYGELARVELPTGGAYEYDYGAGTTNGGTGGVIFLNGIKPQIYRRVVERRVYSDGVNLTSRMTYSVPETETSPACCSVTTAGYVTTAQYDSSGTLRASTDHHLYGSGAANTFLQGPLAHTFWEEGKETETDAYDTNGTAATTLLRQTVNTWQLGTGAGSNGHISETDMTVEPSGADKVSKQTFAYDQYENQTDVYDYDYGTGAAGGLLRHTQTSYLTTNPVNATDYTTTSIYLRDLPTQVSVYDAGGIEKARTTFEYDNYQTDAQHAGLVPRTAISGLDASYTTSYQARGNVTAISQWLLSANTPLTAYSQYDVAGNVVETIDARGYPTTLDFSDRFGSPDGEARSNTAPAQLSGQSSYALATKATNALGQIAYTQFDYYTGLAVDGEDANGIVSSGYYNDALDRPTQLVTGVGTTAQRQSTFAYDDAGRVVTTTSDLAGYGDNVLKGQALYDGMGRTTESRQYESATNYIAVRRGYDDLGRANQVSDPFRPWNSESPRWTTTQFDALGRTTSVTTSADGAQATTSYSGYVVTATEQTGKQRSSQTDALGRVTSITEGPNDPNFNYQTGYQYDALGNLTTVTQGAQTRTFAYDSLGRVTSATNPESGTVSLQYDSNGNPLVKTDARGVSAHYEYDALNRVTRRWYNGSSALTATANNSPALPAGVGASDEVRYFYDAQTLPAGAPTFDRGYSTGRLVAVTYGGASAGTYDGFDVMGRVVRQVQQTGSVNYTVGAAYNMAGLLTGETYPSGHTVSYNYDAAGRLADSGTQPAFGGNLGDGATRTYASQLVYSSQGGMSQERFGTDTPVYNKHLYNSRGQLAEIRVSTYAFTDPANSTNWNRGAIINHYSNAQGAWGATGGGPDNNGYLKRQEIYVPDNDQISTYTNVVQSYGYDSLNRLTSVYDKPFNGNPDFYQSYSYDRFGNRTVDANNTWNAPAPQFGVNPATNRLTAPAGYSMSYDAAGNLVNDSYSAYGSPTGQQTRYYDAENRMVSAQINSSQSAAYTYDGEGRRVKRNAGTGEVWQVYGIGGELLAEYAAGASPNQPQKEYGYRGGQLLVTATVTGGWGAAPTFDDDPLVPRQTVVQAKHITQLRSAIDSLRTHLGLAGYSWQANASSGALIKADPIIEMRTALDQAIGAPSGGYSAGLAQGQPILAVHIQELRTRVVNAWQVGTVGADVRWLVDDQLGTPRMVVDHTGSLAGMTRHDYLPFGEEVAADPTWRTAARGYGASDGLRQQFTSQQRDSETGLDYFSARYYSHSQGRFASPDPFGGSAKATDPQTLNRYSYVTNNPLNATDPSGMAASHTMMRPPSSVFGDPFAGHEDYTAEDEARYEENLRATMEAVAEADAINGMLRSGQISNETAAQMAADNPMLTVAGSAQDTTHSNNSTIVTVWEPAKTFNLSSTFGHVSYVTMQNDTSFSWPRGILHERSWDKRTPSSKYFEERRQVSDGHGHVLDFGDRINEKFQYALLHAYDKEGGRSKHIYTIWNYNCGKAFNVAINAIRSDVWKTYHVYLPKANMVLPSSTEKYILTNLGQFEKEGRQFEKP
jgi:RHS repeat-associated protein